MHNRARRVYHAAPSVKEREERVVFFALVKDSPPSQTFVKTWAQVECPASERHISAVAETSEISEFEPARSLTVYHPPFLPIRTVD
jgi:hypothetical protein